MLVKDILEELKRLDPETEIFIQEKHMEKGNIIVPLRTFNITGYRCGQFKKECVDAFDRTRYTSVVTKLSSLGMTEKYIIKIR